MVSSARAAQTVAFTWTSCQTNVPGGSAATVVATLNVTITGGSTSVALAVSGLPTGVTLTSLTPNSFTASGTATLTLAVANTTAPGVYTITITPSGGATTPNTYFGLTVGNSVWTSGGANTNWSTSGNWTVAPVPGSTNIFTDVGDAVTATAISNVVDTTTWISSLRYANTNGFQNTLIASGVSLNITNAGGLVMSTAGDPGLGTLTPTATISGAGGTLNLSNAAAQLSVNEGSAGVGGSRGTLIMSNLDTLNASIKSIVLGSQNGPNGDGSQRLAGLLYLPRTNFVTLAQSAALSVYVGTPGTANAQATAVDISHNGGNNAGVVSALYLGQTNVFYVDSLRVGGIKSSPTSAGLLLFNPALANINPVAYFRGTNGSTGRVKWWAIGDMGAGASSGSVATGTNDFSGGTVNALVDTLSLGRDPGASHVAAGNNLGALTFTAGTFDINTIYAGHQSLGFGTSTTPSVGIINVVGAGALLRVNTLLAIPYTYTNSVSATNSYGKLNVTNGTVYVNSITVGSNSTSANSAINLTNAIFVVSNALAASTSRLTNFYAANSTIGLKITADASAKMFVGTLVTGGTTNVIQLDSTPVIFNSYPTQFALVKFASLNLNNFGLTNLPGWAIGATTVSNGPNASLDLSLPTDPRPVITANPAATNNSPGSSVGLSVTVTGAPTLGYQWYFVTNNGAASVTNVLGVTGPSGVSTVSGASTANVLIANAQTNDSANYFVVVTNAYGTNISSQAQVSIFTGTAPPTISGLTNQTVLAGNNATISAATGGTPPPGLQWYLSTNGGSSSNIIVNATNSVLTLTNVQYSQNNYKYYLSATNSAGSIVSNMTLTVTQIAPTITGLTNRVVDVRFNATFTATVGGAPAPALQWSVNGAPILGATNSTLTLTNVQRLQNGYVYSLTATNTAGVTTSNLTLTVTNALFNVQLNGLGSAYSGAGQIGSAGDVWNNPVLANFDNSGTQHSPTATILSGYSLTDNRGAASPVTLSLVGTNYKSFYGTSSGHGEVAGLNNQSLKFDWTGATPVPSATITLAGLPPNTSLDLYGYGTTYNTTPIGSSWTFFAANGGATANQSGSANLGNGMDVTQATNQANSWIKIVGTTDSSGNLNVSVLPTTASGGVWWQIYLNGFQIQLHTQPLVTGLTNMTVIQGNSVTLSPTISGTPAPTFQWQTNGVNIPGETNASLNLNSVQYSQNGYVYSLVSSNMAGMVTNSMTLTVIVTPSITGLNNQSSITGDTAVISPAVSGVPAPVLRWQFNGLNLTDGATGNGSIISGSSTSTLYLTNAQPADTGTYSLVASNSAGVVTNSMTLTISSGNIAPAITGPTDQTVVQTSNATFSASVSGLPVPVLQWRLNGVDIFGATNSSFTVSNVQYSQNGQVYSLVASNSAGMATNSATLYVLVPPAISQQTTNFSATVGSSAQFNVVASGVPDVRYQWNRNGTPVANATNSVYSIASVQGMDNGAIFSVTVSNSVGTVTSSTATLTVLTTMTGAFGPTNGAVNISPDQQLRIVFAGGSPRLNSNGVFTVRDAADNSVLQTIDASQFLSYTPGNTSIQTIPNAGIRTVQGSYSGTAAGSTSYYYMPIALYGNEAWITLTNRLSYGHTYYATCDTGLFLDSTGAAFLGISGTNTWSFSTKASGPATPTASTGPTSITVGQDGVGDFATFQGAFDWIPQSNTLARTVHVLPGIYRDSATLAGGRNFVTIIGDGASRTNAQLIYPFVYFAPPNPVFTAGSLRIESSDVAVENITLDNIIYGVYHPTGYASSGAATNFAGAINTLATTGRRIVFDNVLIKGGQDTIYDINGVIYYHNCEVWGSVDFIYGAALAVFDQCNIVEIRNTGGPVTAPNTAYAQPYGITFLNCTFPQAYVTNGYPYDVGAATTTFMRPWGKDGMTASINCALGNQFSTMGYGTFGNTNEDECRAREYGTTLIGGGVAPTITQRQVAGAYWVNTIDPDYTNNPALQPTDPSLAPPTGINNRVTVTVNPSDYTLSTIFGNSYFNLNGWLPGILPTITTQPANQTVTAGGAALFSVMAYGLPDPTYQWLLNGTNISGATNATLAIANAQRVNAGNYTVVVSNGSGSVTSSVATMTYNNTAPAAQAMTVTHTAGLSLKIAWVDLATNWSDTDLDLIGLNSFNLLTTNGVTLQTNSTWILYTNGPNAADQISYSISDGFGGTATGYIRIVMNPFVTGQNTTVAVSGSSATMKFYGIPGYSYITQRATNLLAPNWIDISTDTVPSGGVFNVTDNFTDIGGIPGSAYYRLKWQP